MVRRRHHPIPRPPPPGEGEVTSPVRPPGRLAAGPLPDVVGVDWGWEGGLVAGAAGTFPAPDQPSAPVPGPLRRVPAGGAGGARLRAESPVAAGAPPGIAEPRRRGPDRRIAVEHQIPAGEAADQKQRRQNAGRRTPNGVRPSGKRSAPLAPRAPERSGGQRGWGDSGWSTAASLSPVRRSAAGLARCVRPSTDWYAVSPQAPLGSAPASRAGRRRASHRPSPLRRDWSASRFSLFSLARIPVLCAAIRSCIGLHSPN